MNLLINPSIVRIKYMPVFMSRIREDIEEHCQMCTNDLPESKALFQHINIVSTYESFFKDAKEPFATNVLKNVTYVNNL